MCRARTNPSPFKGSPQSREAACAGVLARGDAHVNLRFPRHDYREKIWDHCAGQVIVEEAGLVISDAAGGLGAPFAAQLACFGAGHVRTQGPALLLPAGALDL